MLEIYDSTLTLVVGGASSGKSAFAEKLVVNTKRPRVYIATAQAYDVEMKSKIEAHKEMRGPDWTTIEAPFDMPDVLANVSQEKIVLIDCLTLWLSNLLLSDADLSTACTALNRAISDCPAPVVAVSNETGMGIVPEHALGRQFRAAQGQLNQRIAANADRVAYVVAGLPLWLKGGP
ncbi:MAG: bifunctional adenosylcobinamide kinase/adenosylcobinamide-phosphate guanylyltransferase [Dinoroseobacter sp.]|nr:bifunctional adenosylcobinamide kinase/adenosylcobinamide-phosphate guanylyltransferase [Dinoroseobacter sp.]